MQAREIFRDQTLGNLLEARDNASTLLIAEELTRTRLLNLSEALALQGAAALVQTQSTFFPLELAELIELKPGALYPMMHRFEEDDRLFSSTQTARHTGLQVRNFNVYTPTDLGVRVLTMFGLPEAR